MVFGCEIPTRKNAEFEGRGFHPIGKVFLLLVRTLTKSQTTWDRSSQIHPFALSFVFDNLPFWRLARPFFLSMLRHIRRFSVKAKPDPLIPPAIELWEQQHQKPKETQVQNDPLFDHELYTPLATPSTRLSLHKPLHFPRYDQSKRSVQDSFTSIATIDNQPFDSDPQIGEYPKLVQQWTALKDPFGYWDRQGRRNYGEVVQDMDNFLDIWSIGPEQSPVHARRALMRSVGFVLVICGLVYAWDPSKHALWVAMVDVGRSGFPL
jgi:hypothetical protein